MPRSIHAHLLPQLMSGVDLSGGVAVVIDILRASSTICTALAHEATAVIPSLDIETAFRLKQESSGGTLLGGERGGEPIDGFDLGNSPLEYSADVVANRTVIFTTTNGTKALLQCQQADVVLIGSFLNFSQVAQALQAIEKPVHLICAGTDGVVTGEDCLFAGAIIDELDASNELNDQAILCHSYWRELGRDQQSRVTTMKQTQGGKNLVRLQRSEDIELCAQLDSLDVLPRWDAHTNQITRQSAGRT